MEKQEFVRIISKYNPKPASWRGNGLNFTNKQANFFYDVAQQVRLDLAQEYVQAGRVATLVGKYPTGEDQYSYDLDNAKIGECVRKSFLELAADEERYPKREGKTK